MESQRYMKRDKAPKETVRKMNVRKLNLRNSCSSSNSSNQTIFGDPFRALVMFWILQHSDEFVVR